MFQKEAKPVDLLVIENTFIAGEPVLAGTKLKNCDAQLAMDLASGGKVRLATDDALAAWKKREAAAKAVAESAAESMAQAEAAKQNALLEAAAAMLKAAGLIAPAAAPAKA